MLVGSRKLLVSRDEAQAPAQIIGDGTATRQREPAIDTSDFARTSLKLNNHCQVYSNYHYFGRFIAGSIAAASTDGTTLPEERRRNRPENSRISMNTPFRTTMTSPRFSLWVKMNLPINAPTPCAASRQKSGSSSSLVGDRRAEESGPPLVAGCPRGAWLLLQRRRRMRCGHRISGRFPLCWLR